MYFDWNCRWKHKTNYKSLRKPFGLIKLIKTTIVKLWKTIISIKPVASSPGLFKSQITLCKSNWSVMLAPHSRYNCGAKFYVAPGNSRNICKSNKHTESLLGLSEDITFYKLECTRNNSQGNYRLNGPVCVTTRKRDYYRKCCRNRLDPKPKLGKNLESKRPRAKKSF